MSDWIRGSGVLPRGEDWFAKRRSLDSETSHVRPLMLAFRQACGEEA